MLKMFFKLHHVQPSLSFKLSSATMRQTKPRVSSVEPNDIF